jgi:prolyl-tRNA editing enzyme YbaK/EbsC (Cys-tRNA(Pro) deacylase)
VDEVLSNTSVKRIIEEMRSLGIQGEVRALLDSARTAAEAAAALGGTAGQIASSIVFKLPDGSPLLVVTSGAHRVNTEIVANALGVEKLHRADADYVKEVSGISIGGVSPFGWITKPTILVDKALGQYDVVWAAAGHAHAVFPTTYDELVAQTGGNPMVVAID